MELQRGTLGVWWPALERVDAPMAYGSFIKHLTSRLPHVHLCGTRSTGVRHELWQAAGAPAAATGVRYHGIAGAHATHRWQNMTLYARGRRWLGLRSQYSLEAACRGYGLTDVLAPLEAFGDISSVPDGCGRWAYLAVPPEFGKRQDATRLLSSGWTGLSSSVQRLYVGSKLAAEWVQKYWPGVADRTIYEPQGDWESTPMVLVPDGSGTGDGLTLFTHALHETRASGSALPTVVFLAPADHRETEGLQSHLSQLALDDCTQVVTCVAETDRVYWLALAAAAIVLPGTACIPPWTIEAVQAGCKVAIPVEQEPSRFLAADAVLPYGPGHVDGLGALLPQLAALPARH